MTLRRMIVAVLAGLALAGCPSSPDPTPTTPTPTQTPPPTETPPPTQDPTQTPPAAGGRQGEACQAGACQSGLTCVEYYGIAGARGPKFTSCEIPCPGMSACPSGQTCRRIADGPGEVCRADDRPAAP